MALQFIFENDFGKAEYDGNQYLLIVKFSGVVNVESAKEVFTEVTKFIETHKIVGGIIDCMEMKGTFTSMNSWFNKEYFPKMKQHGYKCWSLATTDIFSKYAASLLINMITPKGIQAKIFGSLDKATEWTLDNIKMYLDQEE